MSLRQQIIRGGRDILVGQLGQQGLSFLRNIIIARLISPDDFGIAASFVVVIAMLDLMSDMGVSRFIIQATDGDNPEVQSTLHLVMAVRGALIGFAIFLGAGLAARSFGVPEAVWAYQWLAIIPFIKGFMHLDYKRVQRKLAYRTEIVTIILSQCVGVVSVIIFGLWFRSFEAILWATILQTATLVVATHKFAERRFEIGISVPILRRTIAFGWPLMLNGILLFATSQGDRLIIGSSIGVEALGIYAAAALLPLAPLLLLSRVLTDIYMPVLSSATDDPPRFRRRYDSLTALCGLAAVAAFVPIITVGQLAVIVIFGPEYQGPKSLVAWLAMIAAARILLITPTITALAIGKTRILVIANAMRIFGLGAAIIAARNGYGLVEIATLFATAELLVTVTAMVRVNNALQYSIYSGFRIFIPASGLCLTAVAYVIARSGPGPTFEQAMATIAIVTLGVTYILSLSAETRRDLSELSSAAITKMFPRTSDN